MVRPDKYVRIDNDVNSAMTTIGKIIRDAWVFNLLDEAETCRAIAGTVTLVICIAYRLIKSN